MKNKTTKKSQFDINSQEIVKVLSIDEVRKQRDSLTEGFLYSKDDCEVFIEKIVPKKLIEH